MLNEVVSRFFSNARVFLTKKMMITRVSVYLFSAITLPVCINNISNSWRQFSMGGLLFVVLINLLLLAHDAHVVGGGGGGGRKRGKI
jgi:hypothetical protein